MIVPVRKGGHAAFRWFTSRPNKCVFLTLDALK